jgi:hypothetical protein
MGRKRNDLAAIRAQFPSIDNLDWERAFRLDTELYGRVWKDILKADQVAEGRPGPRPPLDLEKASKRYLQLTGEDYVFTPFKEAFRDMIGSDSIRKVSSNTGLDRNLVARLLSGDVEPDNYEMEVIATAYGRRPSYFLEYRIGYVLMMVHAHMMKYPESSVSPYVKVRDRLGKKA